MKSLIALLLSIMLLGCGTTSPVTQVRTVEIPIATKCEPTTNITEIKEFPFDKATKDMDLYTKLQLVLVELHLVRGQNEELKAALKECTK